MNSERLKQIEEIYHAAADTSPDNRESFLNESCGVDESLRREVESLLAFEKTPDNFIDASPESLAAEMFSDRENNEGLINETIGHYRIVSKIGDGGMGDVYLAEDTKLGRKVALKILPEVFAGDQDRMGRFVREAKSASALNHPNIITIYEINQSAGINFIATEFIDGKTLNEYADGRPLQPKLVLDIAIQIASALGEAHVAGIVHRDIKPENIMIRPDGLVKILDFGIAKLTESVNIKPDLEAATSIKTGGTRPGMIIGTADYMSPEQARGRSVDPRSDIFSFGAVMYEVLAGKKAFDGENAVDTIGAILHKEPIPLSSFLPDLPSAIEKIIDKTLRKKVDERYQNIKDVLADLRNVKKRLDYEEVENSLSPEMKGSRTDRQKTQLLDSAVLDQKISLENVPPIALARENEPDWQSDSAKVTRITDNAGSGPKNISTNDVIKTQTATSSSGEMAISPPYVRPKGVLLTALIIVLLATGGFFGYRYFTADSQIRSIAVMPFANETGNANNEYLTDGMSDSVIDKLSQLPQLKVIARSSAFKYKGKEIDVGAIAKALGVQAIVTGRITQQSDNLQISIEMINATDNTRIWGEIYNRKVSTELNVPEEIAQAVSEKLQLKLSGAQELQIAKQITNNPQAYQIHLNGIFFRRKNGAENIRKAIEYQNQAIALDPNFTRAYIELSINYANLISIGALSPKEGLPQARSAAEKALALDETLADAYYNIARIREFEFEWTSAERAFKRAIELNPNLAAAHTVYSEYLSQLGRYDEALREVKLAQELDPLRTGLVGNEGLVFYQARRYDEAIVKAQIHAASAPENPFAHLYLANAYAAKGQYAEAFLSFQTSIKLEETPSALIYLGRAYALTGKRDEAIAVLAKLKTTEKYVSPAELAILYTALGDKEKAFALLETAYTERDTQLISLKVEPGYDPLRDEARFQDLMRRVGLVQ